MILQEQMLLKVSRVVRETFEAFTIYFEDPGQRVRYRPGQFLTLTVPIDGKRLSRPYSLCTSPYLDAQPGVTVKRVPGGPMSNYLADTVQPGDELEVSGPAGTLTTGLNPENQRHLVLFGRGSGITPLLSLARSVLHVEPASSVTLVYANRGLESIIFKDLLLSMQQLYGGRLVVIHVLEFVEYRPLRDMVRGFHFLPGRLSTELTEELLCSLANCHAPHNQYFICGPEGMMETVTSVLRKLRVPGAAIHQERFSATVVEPLPSIPEERAHQVSIRYRGGSYQVTVPANQTILAAAARQGLELPHSCRGALCGTCRAKLRLGQVGLD